MEILVSVQIDFLKISYLSDFGCSTSFGTGVIWWRLGSLILYISASHKLLCFLEATLNGRQERNEQNNINKDYTSAACFDSNEPLISEKSVELWYVQTYKSKTYKHTKRFILSRAYITIT